MLSMGELLLKCRVFDYWVLGVLRLTRATADSIVNASGKRIIDGNSGVVGTGDDVAVGFEAVGVRVAASEGR